MRTKIFAVGLSFLSAALVGCSSPLVELDASGQTSPASYSASVFKAEGRNVYGVTHDKFKYTKFFGQICSAYRNTLVPVQEKQSQLCDNQGGTFSLITHESGKLAGHQTAICKLGTQLRFVSLVNKDEDDRQVSRTCGERNYKRLTLNTLEVDGDTYLRNTHLGKYLFEAEKLGYVPTESNEIRQLAAYRLVVLYNSM
jgi:hypothetical protein